MASDSATISSVSQSPEGVIWRPDTNMGWLEYKATYLSQSPEGVIWRPDHHEKDCHHHPEASVSIPRRGHLASGPTEITKTVELIYNLSQSPEGVIWRPDGQSQPARHMNYVCVSIPRRGHLASGQQYCRSPREQKKTVSIPRRGHLASGPIAIDIISLDLGGLNPPKGSFGVRTPAVSA